ncbi:YicC family protein [Endozoicomonas gorgoniicola]|uniref:YicC family protein n=1 Tax=Endozoicomonas gorgoniicola TaxID=1234144 RepID=A0ABT3N0S6_9GAMM|nr:YicC/YloC family endoribonuclease [Endozoicomonas gorgoniicola]MCW7555237.1 YicC family protein [Endozoicomonas gorgoniicola]
MTSSMTAFARVQVQEDWGSLVWEIRSVNHRYLEPHFRLSEQAREIEPGLREVLRRQLSRGKIECNLRLQLAESTQKLTLNEAALEGVQSAVNQVETWFINASGVDPLEILRWPGVMENEETNLAPVHAAALKAFEEAITQLINMRQREGAELKQFVLTRLNSISEEVGTIRGVLPELIEAQRQKILDRLEEAKAELDPERLEQEMIILAQKMDVDEELDRLDTHIQEVKRTLDKKGGIGRRLDFLMQELNREANTLSSKSINAGLTQSAVNLKVLIEQMREQIQNIE